MDLRHFIRTYDDDLDASHCERLVASFGALARFHEPNGAELKVGLAGSAWTELNVTRLADAAFRGFFRHRITQALQRYNADVGLHPIAVPDSAATADLILKRYRPGGTERFQPHFDSIYEVANRYLVFLWYLNDVEQGGETVFPQLDVRVAAKRGRLLMFPPYWMYQHAGEPPVSGDKYILSTYLLFQDSRT